MAKLACKCDSSKLCCHKCGQPVKIVMDGEEWCDRCGTYQRPREHGWARAVADKRAPVRR